MKRSIWFIFYLIVTIMLLGSGSLDATGGDPQVTLKKKPPVKKHYDIDIHDLFLDKKCRLWITHKNNGTRKINKVLRERVWVNGRLVDDSRETLIINPGQTFKHGVGANPGVIIKGNAVIKAQIDVDNILPESNERNNIMKKRLQCKLRIKPVSGIIKPLKPIQYRFEIQGIKRIMTRPDKIKFQVQYYISPGYPKACFIGAALPGKQYAHKPAGRLPNGVPKGQKHFTDNIVVELMYRGPDRYPASGFQVSIYDKDQKTLKTQRINYAHNWAYVDFQGIKRIVTTPYRVKWQVQYYISPDYPKACFLGASIPNQSASSRYFALLPAGRLPNGVPKGQKHFRDNITFTLEFKGNRNFRSSTMELYIYDKDQKFLDKDMVNWGQTWAPPTVH